LLTPLVMAACSTIQNQDLPPPQIGSSQAAP
jgi:hypothetical protein